MMSRIKISGVSFDRVDSITEFIEKCSNVIVKRGSSTGTLQQVTEKQLPVIIDYLERKGIKHEVSCKHVGLSGRFRDKVYLREKFSNPDLYPGKKEKAYYLDLINKRIKNKQFTQFSEKEYVEMRERLLSIPDKSDIIGYSVQYNYYYDGYDRSKDVK